MDLQSYLIVISNGISLKFQQNFQLSSNEFPLVFQWNFYWITWNFNVFQFLFRFNFNSDGFTLIFLLNFNWISNRFQLVFHWNLNLIPMDLNCYLIDISICLSLKFQLDLMCFHWYLYWVSTGFPIDFNWYLIEI